MIRVLVEAPGGKATLIAGITDAELATLRAGHGVAIPLDGLAARPDEVALMYRPTHHDLLEELAPLIGRDTIVEGSLREADGGPEESEAERG